MIPEYKLYHGAALAELIDAAHGPVTIDELLEDGRLRSYVINGSIGLQIKHSTSRMSPWLFTFTRSNTLDLLELARRYKDVFIVLVCWVDGFVCLTLNETLALIEARESDQVWIKAQRRKNEWYTVSGSALSERKKPQGLGQLIERIGGVSDQVAK